MGKLDLNGFNSIDIEYLKVLEKVEHLHKKFQIVPEEVIAANLPSDFGSVHSILHEVCRSGYLCLETSRKYRGYRLTNLGYDILALKALVRRNKISGFGYEVAQGKESKIYSVTNEDNDQEDALCVKLTRLGRTCFRSIRNKRDYIPNNSKSKSQNWLALSKVSAHKEYIFMKTLKENGFPVPTAFAQNRHCIVMEYIDGLPLKKVTQLEKNTVENLYSQLMDLIVKFATHGCIHGDFNEFNIIIKAEDESPVIIDFPQMVSTSHINAKMFFERDVECIKIFFGRQFCYSSPNFPVWSEVKEMKKIKDLDKELHTSGFSRRQNEMLLRAFAKTEKEYYECLNNGDNKDNSENSSSDEEDGESHPKSNEDNYDEERDDDVSEDDEKEEQFLSKDKRDNVNKWFKLSVPSEPFLDHDEEVSEEMLMKYEKGKALVKSNEKELAENLEHLEFSEDSDDSQDEIEDSASQIDKNKSRKKKLTPEEKRQDLLSRVNSEAKRKVKERAIEVAKKNARRAVSHKARSNNKKSVLEYNKGWDRFGF